MILHSLRVSHFRSWLSTFELRLDDQRVNLISGPNGAGKSSLFLALAGVLREKHNAASAAVRAWQPWGTKLGPAVELEFATRGRRYRIAKKWISGKSALLSERRDSSFFPLAEAAQADQDLDRLFDSEALEILLAPQRELPKIDAGASVIRAVQDSLGAQSNSPLVTGVLSRIRADYLTWFTPTGRPKANTALAEAEAKHNALVDRQQALARARQAASQLLETIHQRRRQASQEQATLANLEGSRARYLAGLELENTLAKLEQLRVNESLPLLERQAQALRHAEFLRLSDLLATHGALAAKIATIDQERKELRAPTQADLQQARRLVAELDSLAVRIDASLIHLAIETVGPIVTTIVEGDQGSEANTFLGSPRVVVEVAGLGRIRASGPTADTGLLREQRRQSQTRLEELLARYDARDLAELERRFEQDHRLQTQRQELEAERTRLLAGKPLGQYLNREQQLRELGAETPIDAPGSPGATLDAVEEKLKLARERARPVAETREQLEELRQEQERALARLAPDKEPLPANFPALLEQHRAKLMSLEEEIRSLDLEAVRLLAQGAPEEMQAVEEELALAESNLDRLRLEAAAARMLHTMAEEAQNRALGQYVIPVAERVRTLLRQFSQRLDGEIGLTAKLQPERYLPSSAASAVAVTELSAGEFDLLHLCVRLALAETLAAGEPQALVLDDSFTATDAERFDRVLDYLFAATPRLQIVLFTCHPDRFAHRLPNMHHVPLP